MPLNGQDDRVLGWHSGETQTHTSSAEPSALLGRLRRAGTPFFRPWRYRRGALPLWWTSYGSRTTFRVTGELLSPPDIAKARPVAVVRIEGRGTGSIMTVKYRPALGPMFLRCASLGLLGLTISHADDERKWSEVRRALDGAISPALLEVP